MHRWGVDVGSTHAVQDLPRIIGGLVAVDKQWNGSDSSIPFSSRPTGIPHIAFGYQNRMEGMTPSGFQAHFLLTAMVSRASAPTMVAAMIAIPGTVGTLGVLGVDGVSGVPGSVGVV